MCTALRHLGSSFKCLAFSASMSREVNHHSQSLSLSLRDELLFSVAVNIFLIHYVFFAPTRNPSILILLIFLSLEQQLILKMIWFGQKDEGQVIQLLCLFSMQRQ